MSVSIQLRIYQALLLACVIVIAALGWRLRNSVPNNFEDRLYKEWTSDYSKEIAPYGEWGRDTIRENIHKDVDTYRQVVSDPVRVVIEPCNRGGYQIPDTIPAVDVTGKSEQEIKAMPAPPLYRFPMGVNVSIYSEKGKVTTFWLASDGAINSITDY